MMTIASILARKGGKVVTCRPEHTIRQALTLLAEKMYYVPAVYDSGPRWTIFQGRVKGADEHDTVRSGGTSVQLTHTWIDQ